MKKECSTALCSEIRFFGKTGIYWGLQGCQAVFPRAFDNSLWRAGWSHANGSSSFFPATKLQPQESRVTFSTFLA